MPKVSIEENIKTTIRDIDNLTKEIYRLEGSLRLLQNLKAGGVEEVDVDEEKLRQAAQSSEAKARAQTEIEEVKEETE